MALNKCPECGKQISSTANKCPNCGYKNKGSNSIRSFFLILIASLILIIIFNSKSCNNDENSDNSDNSTDMIYNDEVYSKKWREPYAGSETVSIARIMVKNNIQGCAIFYVKEVSSGEYLVACSSDAENWNYYQVWTNLDKIYSANEDMLKALKPPDLN